MDNVHFLSRNIIVFLPSFELHLQRLEEVFETMRGANVHVNTKNASSFVVHSGSLGTWWNLQGHTLTLREN